VRAVAREFAAGKIRGNIFADHNGIGILLDLQPGECVLRPEGEAAMKRRVLG
jgi:hypothetical protein